LLKNKRSGQAREQRLELKRLRVNARSSTAAEKSGEGMALKIFTGAKAFLKAYIKPFGITEMEMLLEKGKGKERSHSGIGIEIQKKRFIPKGADFLSSQCSDHSSIIRAELRRWNKGWKLNLPGKTGKISSQLLVSGNTPTQDE